MKRLLLLLPILALLAVGCRSTQQTVDVSTQTKAVSAPNSAPATTTPIIIVPTPVSAPKTPVQNPYQQNQSSGNITISTRQPLTLNKGNYSDISFNLEPVTASTKYTFTEKGGVPGMIFETNACNNNPAWVNNGSNAACMATYKNNISNAYSLELDGTPSVTGTFPFTVTATDQSGDSFSQTFTITVVGSITITNINPSSGPIGMEVTITGTAFTPQDTVMVNFNGYSYDSLSQSSQDGQTLSFVIPQTLSRACAQSISNGDCGQRNVALGDVLSISVMTGLGTLSNTVNFTVTQ